MTYNGIQVLEDLGTNNLHKRVVRARCHCGKEFTCCLSSLKSGNTKSCGCLSKKHMVGDKSLLEVAGDKSEYARCLWIIHNKMMTPEQALNYHRPPAREDKEWIIKVNQRRRYGIDKKYLELPDKYVIEQGFEKQSKYFYNGIRLKKWCEKHKVSYSMVYKRIRKFGLKTKDAIRLTKKELMELIKKTPCYSGTKKLIIPEYENKIKRNIICVETNEVFESVVELAKYLGVSDQTIYRRLKDNKSINGLTYRYKGKNETRYTL